MPIEAECAIYAGRQRRLDFATIPCSRKAPWPIGRLGQTLSPVIPIPVIVYSPPKRRVGGAGDGNGGLPARAEQNLGRTTRLVAAAQAQAAANGAGDHRRAGRGYVRGHANASRGRANSKSTRRIRRRRPSRTRPPCRTPSAARTTPSRNRTPASRPCSARPPAWTSATARCNGGHGGGRITTNPTPSPAEPIRPGPAAEARVSLRKLVEYPGSAPTYLPPHVSRQRPVSLAPVSPRARRSGRSPAGRRSKRSRSATACWPRTWSPANWPTSPCWP